MYRNLRRHAMRGSMRSWFDKINYLFRSNRNSKRFWNQVRMCKDSSSQGSDKVSIHSPTVFYRERFSEKDIDKTDPIKNADIEVFLKYNDMENTVMS